MVVGYKPKKAPAVPLSGSATSTNNPRPAGAASTPSCGVRDDGDEPDEPRIAGRRGTTTRGAGRQQGRRNPEHREYEESEDLTERSDGSGAESVASDDSVELCTETIVVEMPMTRTDCTRCRESFTRFDDLTRQVNRKHTGLTTMAKCPSCDRRNPNPHSISCHIPHCKGLKSPRNQLPHVCECCDKSFRTKSGLSTHKRHAHPERRNEERIQEARGRPEVERWMDRATTTLWSREEVKVLVNHLRQHPGEKGNIRLRELLPAKTPKQISEKKRSKIILNLVDAMQEADPEPTEEIPPTEEVEPEEEVEAEEETVSDEAEEGRASDRGGTSSESEAEPPRHPNQHQSQPRGTRKYQGRPMEDHPGSGGRANRQTGEEVRRSGN